MKNRQEICLTQTFSRGVHTVHTSALRYPGVSQPKSFQGLRMIPFNAGVTGNEHQECFPTAEFYYLLSAVEGELLCATPFFCAGCIFECWARLR